MDAGDADPATGMALFIGVPVTIGAGRKKWSTVNN